MLQLQTFLQYFYKLLKQQIVTALHLGPPFTSLFYLLITTNNNSNL